MAKKEIVNVDKERGIFRITTADERFYTREVFDSINGLPKIDFRPSLTHIVSYYPKDKGFEMYLKKNGDESDEIAQMAAERGSKVHQAIEALNNGITVKAQDKFVNPRNGMEEELTWDEYAVIKSYHDWWQNEGSKEYVILEVEKVVWPEGKGSEEGGPLHFAATLDLCVKRRSDGAIGIIDVKTSKAIYDSHKIQVSAIREAKKAEGLDATWQAILQVGYRLNKHGYKFSEVEDLFDQYLVAKNIYNYKVGKSGPSQIELPTELKLNLSKEPVEPEEEEIRIVYGNKPEGTIRIPKTPKR